jgi:hypothetical protein
MKIIIALALCISTSSYSQCRIAYKLADVKKELGYGNYKSGYPSERWISYAHDMAYIFYNFNENDVCVSTTILPLTNTDLLFFINKYNNEYRRYDNSTWVFVNNGVNLFVSLNQTDDGKYFFYWHL